MVSEQAWNQYTALMEDMKQRKAEEQAAQKKMQEEYDSLSPEVQKIVQAGDEYVRRIKAANDAIPGEVISAKISRMELLVDRIFDRVEQNPDSVNDMRRMMDYYLPTTMKLLEAYEELDAQPVQGENIISSKKEIEDTIDTLNLAFEKLLDSLFQDTAWDVSSDISVLHTMLAQEGLTEDGADQEAVTTEEPKFLSLEEILGMDTADLTAEKQGFFHSEKLGDIPYTAISYDDYKQAKKDCVTYDQDENGVIQTKVDDDKLMTKIVILAVDKDQRSNFTFANGALLKKLGVHTAEGALSTLLPPGEIVNFAVAVQNASGFGNKAKKKVKDSVKNS